MVKETSKEEDTDNGLDDLLEGSSEVSFSAISEGTTVQATANLEAVDDDATTLRVEMDDNQLVYNRDSDLLEAPNSRSGDSGRGEIDDAENATRASRTDFDQLTERVSSIEDSVDISGNKSEIERVLMKYPQAYLYALAVMMMMTGAYLSNLVIGLSGATVLLITALHFKANGK